MNKLKLIGTLITISSIFILSSCNSKNEKLEIKEESGIVKVYYNNKLANGLKEKLIEENNKKIKLSSITYKDGLITGNFELFDENSKTRIKAIGENSNDLFEGEIEEYRDGTLVAKSIGKFSLNTENILNYDYKTENFTTGNILEGETFKYDENNKITAKYLVDEKGNIRITNYFENENIYSEDFYDSERNFLGQLIFDEQGLNIAIIDNIDLTESYFEYYEDGKLKSEFMRKLGDNPKEEIRTFYKSGKLNYHQLREEGKVATAIKYYESGEKEQELEEINFEKGEVYQKDYREDGTIIGEGTIINGEKTKNWKTNSVKKNKLKIIIKSNNSHT